MKQTKKDMIEEPLITNLQDSYEFRTIHPEEGDIAASIEAICFPPNEACIPSIMKERVRLASELFLVAIDKANEKMIGYITGITTDEPNLRDEFFTDTSLHNPEGDYFMILSVAVLPEYRCQGLAGAMMAEHLKRQRAAGRKAAVLTCLESKVLFYKKMGYVDEGISDSSWGGENWHEMRYLIEDYQ